MRFIIYNPATQLFTLFIDALQKMNECIFYDESNIYDYKNDILLILINPHFIFDETYKISQTFRFKILYLSEPINYLIEKRVYKDIINIIKPYCLWTYTSSNLNIFPLKIFNIYPFNQTYIDDIYDKNIKNIVFIGNINKHRIEICNKFDNLINIKDRWDVKDHMEIYSKYLIYLNIHRRPKCESIELFRIIPILANGGVIISERCNIIDQNRFKDYNIIFTDTVYETYENYIKNIDYTNILLKTELFRKDMSYMLEFNKYIEYHNRCV